MRYTQFLIFEVGTKCNLNHQQCPCYAEDRYAGVDTSTELTDEMIVDIAVKMYGKLGFRGLIGWHYYNEPMVYRERVRRLMGMIKERVPEARFILWTNGQLLNGHNDLAGFEMVRITDYEGKNYGWTVEAAPDVHVNRWKLDKRLNAESKPNEARCRRMFTEFVVDFYGNVHACCIDWRGQIKIGNVCKDPIEDVVDKFIDIRMSMAYTMDSDTPDVCKKCALRTKDVANLEKEICGEINDALSDGCLESPSSIAVVCYSHSGDAPDQKWIDSVSSYGVYRGFSSDIRDVNKMLRQAASDGFNEGMVLWPDEIVRNVEELKKGRNMRAIPVGTRGEGEFVMTVNLNSFMYYHRAVPVYKESQGRCDVTKQAVVERRDGIVKAPGTAVVFVCYKIPERRLMEHFEWNDLYYRSSGVSVFVVTDKEYDFLPDYARCLVYPDEMEVFNLSATSNFGIRYAIDSGFERVVKTDVDISYTDGAWREALGVKDGRGVVPLYRMVGSYKKRNSDFSPDGGATGTIAMTSGDWNKAHFNENCVGYGADDKILLLAMGKKNIMVDDCVNRPVIHIAHMEDTPQQNKGGKRVDYWNRDNGYNPRNNVGNNLFTDRPVYEDARWGLGSWSDVGIVVKASCAEELRSFVDVLDGLHCEEGIRLIVLCPKRFDGFGENVRMIPCGDSVEGLRGVSEARNRGVDGMLVWMGSEDSIEDVIKRVKQTQLEASS